jgi:hypothetical protein
MEAYQAVLRDATPSPRRRGEMAFLFALGMVYGIAYAS